MTGELIAGRYRIERKLGTGGMSSVQLATDERLERPVAVKLLAEHLADDPAFVSRFRREALAAARLIHPNIVQVYDHGFDEDSHRHYIVMEYVPGKTCSQIIRDRGRLPLNEALSILSQSCAGLDYAHRNGVVHRDVKPGNLLSSDDGRVKLADFGIARAVEQSRITQVGSVLGTAAYLPPEVARGEEAAPSTDIYALGVVAYQLLAGRLPYEAPSLAELATMREQEAPEPLEQLNPEVPPELAEAIEQALAPDPRDRFVDAATMSEAIEQGAHGIRHPTVAGSGATAVTRAQTRRETPARTRKERTARTTRSREAEVYEPTRTAVQPAADRRSKQPSRRTSKSVDKRESGGAGQAFKKFVVFLLIIAVIGGGAAVAIVATDDSESGVQLRNVIGDTADQTISELKSLVNDNTQ